MTRLEMVEGFPYELTAHAARVIREREIPLEWVARALVNPERTEPDKEDPGLRHALGTVPEFGGRVLRVVYRWETRPWQIVTAYFDRRQRKLP